MTKFKARFSYRFLIVLSVVSLLAVTIPIAAPPQPIGHLIPMGGGYTDAYAGFSKEAVANAKNNQVKILILPVAYASNSESITAAERADDLKAVEDRRQQIVDACQRAAPQDVTCAADLAPILTHSDAENPDALTDFSDDLSAIFIVGDDPAVGMQVISGTPIEERLAAAYQKGVIIAGTGAAGGMQSVVMLAGYKPKFTADNSLDFGAVDVWNTRNKHGLLFGLKSAILDQHFYQRSQLGRLLNAIALPDVPQVGVGLDGDTAVNVYGETRLQDVFGLYTVTILDAETYHAADAVQYAGPDHVISLRNVLVQLMSPGQFAYDLDQRVLTIGTRAQPPQATVKRDFAALALPRNAGPLILGGDLSKALDNNDILNRFVELAGRDKAKMLIVATGYSSRNAAQAAASQYAQALGVPYEIALIVDQSTPLTVPQDATGIVLISKDQSKLDATWLKPIRTAWLAGRPLLADDGGAAVVGKFYSAHGPTPKDENLLQVAVQQSFLLDSTQIAPGLGLLGITVEPQVLNDNRWGRLFSLAYNQPALVSFGLTQNTALEITREGVTTLGSNGIFALDLRGAKLGEGTNGGFVIANGLLDVFAPGDDVKPTVADVKAALTRGPTPPLPTDTPEPTMTPTKTPPPTPTDTATPRPSVTNRAPDANAGPDQNVAVNANVMLDGSASSDPDGHWPLSYGWQQIGGAAVVLSSSTISRPTFMAPGVPVTLTFSLVVTDARGLASTPDQVVVTASGLPIIPLAIGAGLVFFLVVLLAGRRPKPA